MSADKNIYINGYKIIKPFTCANSGYAKWGFVQKNGVDYFIKEFLCPVYPKENSPASVTMIQKKRADCESFYLNKRELYDSINKASNGNIVQIQDFFLFNSRYYLVTDKIEVSNMQINEVASLPIDKKILILKVLSHSVNSISKRGIIHGDLKPDNILIKKTAKGFYTVKLIDFDASFFEYKPPDVEELQGDTVYVAPETFLKLSGEDIVLTTKTDVFALGIIFHQYLSGTLPVIQGEYDFIYEAVLDDSSISLSESIPENLRALIMRMLTKDSEHRIGLSDIFAEIIQIEKKLNAVVETPVVTAGDKGDIPVSRKTDNKNFRPSFDFDI